ncbi:MAG: helix-turn-helix transcriptional regulator [Syntrophomonas sp.]
MGNVGNVDISKRLTELREQQGLSMRKLAERADLSQAFISSIEAGRKQPTLDSLMKLSFGLGITLIELLGGETATHLLPPHLQTLLSNARQLTPEQVNALNQFIRSMVEL